MKRIDEINKIRKSLDDEVKMIEENCTHDEYHIGIFSWRIGCYDLMRICENCYSTKLGSPSDEEEKEYYTEMYEKKKIDNPFIQGKGSKIYKSNFIITGNITTTPLPETFKVSATNIGLDLVEVKPLDKPFI